MDVAKSLASLLSSQLSSIASSVMQFIGSISHILFLWLSFLSALYCFLQSDASQLYYRLSPFPSEDSDRIARRFERVIRTSFSASVQIFVVHFIGSYMALAICSVDLKLMLSMLCSFFSILPFMSPTIIWLPLCFALLLSNQLLQALTISITQIVLSYVVEPQLLSRVDSNSLIIGPSVVLGVLCFGANGIIVGPLLVGLSVTILEIFLHYQTVPSGSGNTGFLSPSASAIPIAPPTPGLMSPPSKLPRATSVPACNFDEEEVEGLTLRRRTAPTQGI